jgi:hypothetical protein
MYTRIAIARPPRSPQPGEARCQEGKRAAVLEPGSDDRDFIHQEASSPPKTDADVTGKPGVAPPGFLIIG